MTKEQFLDKWIESLPLNSKDADRKEMECDLGLVTAKLRKENERLKEALKDLMSWQNGSPLPTYEKGWNAAMEKAEKALNQ